MAATVTPPEAFPPSLRSRQILLRRVATILEAPPWLPEAERAVRSPKSPCLLGDRIAAADGVYWIDARLPKPTRQVGAFAARVDAAALVWTWLAVDADWRAFGYGGAAVPVLERAALRAGCTNARVLTPQENGVGLYFWLRLGYRPIANGSWPMPYDGTWMTCALD